ncbi:HNH endonuclease [Hoyosella altamirensis]|uniref:5-methylcytosine-specific restriction endonuclease McrA n=1 Tax=Hoyosella altamirensis TaxID=616997 RepID=A0A839RS17_9ACTN|nr:5-methylcytosine-specific restriction endonuclease McrA [Hoyosella altamirensis]
MAKRSSNKVHHRQLVPGVTPNEWVPRAIHGDHLAIAHESPPPAEAVPEAQRAPMRGWASRRVLLLNASYEPLTTVPVRRALVLMLRNRAEMLHSDPAGTVVHSAGRQLYVPSVIRLTVYVHVPYIARVPLTRAALMQRDRFRCGYCGAKADTIDHVVPRSRGGEHVWENCVACCARCNHKKADRLLSELGWSLRTIPRPPAGRHWYLVSKIDTFDPVWGDYVPALESA